MAAEARGRLAVGRALGCKGGRRLAWHNPAWPAAALPEHLAVLLERHQQGAARDSWRCRPRAAAGGVTLLWRSGLCSQHQVDLQIKVIFVHSQQCRCRRVAARTAGRFSRRRPSMVPVPVLSEGAAMGCQSNKLSAVLRSSLGAQIRGRQAQSSRQSQRAQGMPLPMRPGERINTLRRPHVVNSTGTRRHSRQQKLPAVPAEGAAWGP